MTQLASLLFDPRTRVGGESIVYFNLSVGKKIGSIVKTLGSYSYIPETSCAGTLTSPLSGFSAAVLARPNGSAITITGAVSAPSGVQIPTANNVFDANSPIGMACEITGTYSENITDYTGTVTGGSVGDQIDIINFPPPSQDTLLCYDQGFSVNLGTNVKPIPRKFNPADHYVKQRPENKITLTDLLVDGWVGLRRLNGILCCMIVKYFPDGGATPTEIQYFNNVRFTVPPGSSPQSANESIEIRAEGDFNQFAAFAAKP